MSQCLGKRDKSGRLESVGGAGAVMLGTNQRGQEPAERALCVLRGAKLAQRTECSQGHLMAVGKSRNLWSDHL